MDTDYHSPTHERRARAYDIPTHLAPHRLRQGVMMSDARPHLFCAAGAEATMFSPALSKLSFRPECAMPISTTPMALRSKFAISIRKAKIPPEHRGFRRGAVSIRGRT